MGSSAAVGPSAAQSPASVLAHWAETDSAARPARQQQTRLAHDIDSDATMGMHGGGFSFLFLNSISEALPKTDSEQEREPLDPASPSLLYQVADREPDVTSTESPCANRTNGERPAPPNRADTADAAPVQRKELPGDAADIEDDEVHHAAAAGTEGSGGELPFHEQIQRCFGEEHDLSQVRAYVGGRAASAAQAIGATAYATGTKVAFAQNPDLHTAAHEAAHVLQQRRGVQLKGGVGSAGDEYERHADSVADRVVQGLSAADLLGHGAPREADEDDAVQRKEVKRDADIKSKKDWTKADREGKTQRWKDACLTNLNAIDSSQYVKIVERRDFYKWFYEHTAALGYTTRWAMAANLVADGAHQIADMDEESPWANDALGLASVELQGVMREGNQVIFDNVLPKLKRLLDGGPLKGKAALKWDMQILAEEQALIQPLYNRMSKKSLGQLDYIARKKRFAGFGAWWTGGDKVAEGPYNNKGTVPAFSGSDLSTVSARWRYGMDLGNQFTPGGSGFDPNVNTMPTPDKGYNDGTELSKVDTRANLHQLDAWLNPNRLSRPEGTPGADINSIINRLTPFEKAQVLTDESPDGWAYSNSFAQFISIEAGTVRQALPAEPAHAGAVNGFMSRFQTERERVNIRYPTYYPYPGMF